MGRDGGIFCVFFVALTGRFYQVRVYIRPSVAGLTQPSFS
jgi:hypothetical protein